MSRHSRTSWRSRLYHRIFEKRLARCLQDFEAAEDARGYLAEYIHPVIGDRPFDAVTDETRFDLIRVHPYNPPKGEDHAAGQAGPGYQVPDGAGSPGDSSLRLHGELHSHLPAGGSPSRERGSLADAAPVGRPAYGRGWTRHAAPEAKGSQPPAAAAGFVGRGWRNPGR